MVCKAEEDERGKDAEVGGGGGHRRRKVTLRPRVLPDHRRPSSSSMLPLATGSP